MKMNKNIIILLTPLFFIACGGGGGENTESTVVADENISNILGSWYLPDGCSIGIETAQLTISQDTETSNKLAISFYYFDDNNDYYAQYINVELIDSSISPNGDIAFNLQLESVRDSGGASDLYIQGNGPIRLVNNKLEFNSLCLINEVSSFVKQTELAGLVENRLLGESLVIRDYYKSIFDDDWTQAILELARRGQSGGTQECNLRVSLVNDYLDSLFLSLYLNDTKFHIFDSELADGWIDQVYMTLSELDIQELPLRYPRTTCDSTDKQILNEIAARYALGH